MAYSNLQQKRGRLVPRLERGVLGLVAVLLGAACGGDDQGGKNHVADPQPAPGGGVGGGGVAGELNVFVVDETTDAPVAGASVVVEIAQGELITGTTSAAGLFTITDDRLAGGQDVTVVKSGYRTASWLGANGAVVTIPLAATSAPPLPPTASASGTIEGWDDLPAPPDEHYVVAVVGFSYSKRLGGPENEIQQPSVPGVPLNACIKIPASAGESPPCAWSLVTRVGPQSHWAILVDVDTKGTEAEDDDTREVIGYALKTGLDLNEGQNSSGEILTLLEDGPTSLEVRFPAAPAGLSVMSGFVLVHLGEELFPMIFSGLTPDAPSVQVPALAGPFATATYDLFVQARASAVDESPQSFALMRGVDASGPISITELLPLPGGLTATGGNYGFTAVPGATLHTASLRSAAGDELWAVGLLDGRTTFTLPELAGTALPSGALELHVSALVLPGFDPQDFALDDFLDLVERSSEGFVSFTRE